MIGERVRDSEVRAVILGAGVEVGRGVFAGSEGERGEDPSVLKRKW